MKSNIAIEKKAKEFAGYNMSSSPDAVTIAEMDGRYDGFMAGAEWMRKKRNDFAKYDYIDGED